MGAGASAQVADGKDNDNGVQGAGASASPKVAAIDGVDDGVKAFGATAIQGCLAVVTDAVAKCNQSLSKMDQSKELSDALHQRFVLTVKVFRAADAKAYTYVSTLRKKCQYIHKNTLPDFIESLDDSDWECSLIELQSYQQALSGLVEEFSEVQAAYNEAAEACVSLAAEASAEISVNETDKAAAEQRETTGSTIGLIGAGFALVGLTFLTGGAAAIAAGVGSVAAAAGAATAVEGHSAAGQLTALTSAASQLADAMKEVNEVIAKQKKELVDVQTTFENLVETAENDITKVDKFMKINRTDKAKHKLCALGEEFQKLEKSCKQFLDTNESLRPVDLKGTSFSSRNGPKALKDR